MKIGNILEKVKVALPFVPLTLSELLSKEEIWFYSLTALAVFWILYGINIPKVLFDEKRKLPNITFSVAGTFIALALITNFNANIYFMFFISSLVLVLVCSWMIGNRFSENNKSGYAEKINRYLYDMVAGEREKKLCKFLSIFIFVLLAYAGTIFLILLILSLHFVYLYLFIILLIYSFAKLWLDKRKKASTSKLIEEALLNTDHFEGDFFKDFLDQLLTFKGFIYSFLFLFSVSSAAVGSVFAIFSILGSLTINDEIMQVVINFPFPQITYFLVTLFLIFSAITLLFLYFYPFYFNLKIIQSNLRRHRHDKEKVHVLPKSLWSLTFLLFHLSPTIVIFQVSPITTYIVSMVIPIINFFMITRYLIKKDREVLTLKTEELGAIILVINIILSTIILDVIFPVTLHAEDILFATIFISILIIGLLAFSILTRVALGDKPITQLRYYLKNRWKN
jgi:hypothetical protein